MVPRALVSAAAVAAVDFPRLPHNYPVPPTQTDTQKKIFAQKAAAAKQASDAATPQVLAFFDSHEFREAMHTCCPTVASMTSQDILERYRAEARIGELAHSFPGSMSSASHFIDLTIDAAFEYPWFLNEVQARLIDNNTETRFQNGIEEALFGCVPFQVDQKPTWDEAADRLIYVASNMREFDFGSVPVFGDVTAIFDVDYVKDMVVIAPMDTGMYWNSCHESGHHWAPSANCSVWSSEVIGTLDHLDHLILPNFAYFYNYSESGQTIIDGAKAFFSHSAFAGDYASLPNTTSSDVMMYFESNIMGNPRMAGGVKFLIGSFPALFGTDLGRRLQELAAYYAWPLFWAYGSGGSWSHHSQSALYGNRRFADPTSISNLTNLTTSAAALRSFDSAWDEAATARAAQGGNATVEQVQQWWGELEAEQVRVAPLTSTSCADAAQCVAVEVASSRCICKKGSIQEVLV